MRHPTSGTSPPTVTGEGNGVLDLRIRGRGREKIGGGYGGGVGEKGGRGEGRGEEEGTGRSRREGRRRRQKKEGREEGEEDPCQSSVIG